MYSTREKITHLRSLHAPSNAVKDLELLKAKTNLDDNKIEVYETSPIRYAEEILFALLDLATVKEIRNNRRDKSAPEVVATKVSEKKETKKEEQKKSSKSTKSTPTSTGKTSKTKISK